MSRARRCGFGSLARRRSEAVAWGAQHPECGRGAGAGVGDERRQGYSHTDRIAMARHHESSIPLIIAAKSRRVSWA
jgi:hypothetical protein